MRKIRQIADHLHFRVTRNRKVLVHDDAASPVSRYAESFSDERRIVARRPNFHAAGNELVANLDAGLSEICCPRICAHFHAEVSQLFARALRQIRRISSQQA